ncbi:MULTISPECIES: hypothetical protein [unclassified Moorena]|uniref:hypothetical protein n=1 Tax=unclassified Moorena TaxID=2683338 RepID=UPI0013BF7EA8|nr:MULTISPECIES: hypothetical protein [unclassified Moorena]NEO05304.1 hypothetical protein [Moorena sp. SIO3I8]NEO21209.1 hypothetical protein [Moorena sp. SIO4A5]NEP24965.1 hypothetical protein [Moorena sp. SIO3I6]NEQ59935.1 hypothetical protein [Moorena sp. SIO4A1]
MYQRFQGYIENIFLGIVGGLLTTVILALVTHYFVIDKIAVKQYKAIIELFLY